jgi:hypothetical protein
MYVYFILKNDEFKSVWNILSPRNRKKKKFIQKKKIHHLMKKQRKSRCIFLNL